MKEKKKTIRIILKQSESLVTLGGVLRGRRESWEPSRIVCGELGQIMRNPLIGLRLLSPHGAVFSMAESASPRGGLPAAATRHTGVGFGVLGNSATVLERLANPPPAAFCAASCVACGFQCCRRVLLSIQTAACFEGPCPLCLGLENILKDGTCSLGKQGRAPGFACAIPSSDVGSERPPACHSPWGPAEQEEVQAPRGSFKRRELAGCARADPEASAGAYQRIDPRSVLLNCSEPQFLHW